MGWERGPLGSFPWAGSKIQWADPRTFPFFFQPEPSNRANRPTRRLVLLCLLSSSTTQPGTRVHAPPLRQTLTLTPAPISLPPSLSNPPNSTANSACATTGTHHPEPAGDDRVAAAPGAAPRRRLPGAVPPPPVQPLRRGLAARRAAPGLPIAPGASQVPLRCRPCRPRRIQRRRESFGGRRYAEWRAAGGPFRGVRGHRAARGVRDAVRVPPRPPAVQLRRVRRLPGLLLLQMREVQGAGVRGARGMPGRALLYAGQYRRRLLLLQP